MSARRVRAGIEELREVSKIPPATKQRVRRPGGGRRPLEVAQPHLLKALESLVDPATRGDPESPLRWTSKSLRRLAAELKERGYSISPTKVGQLLRGLGYSLQANKKTVEGKQHRDRDEQFGHINDQARRFMQRGSPVISVDTKKKEVVGNLKNAGKEWEPTNSPVRVDVHDFPDPDVGKAVPYGVYDVSRNEASVNVGTSHDTAAFAVASIGVWYSTMGKKAYPDATEVLITADAGGSNGYRSRQWKTELQHLADRTGLTITVCHFPPGTSKWNKIEHRLFSQISQNWRGRPLTTHETVVQLIAATTTTTGLRVRARLDQREYPKGVKIADSAMAAIQLTPARFHGEWNYTIRPRKI